MPIPTGAMNHHLHSSHMSRIQQVKSAPAVVCKNRSEALRQRPLLTCRSSARKDKQLSRAQRAHRNVSDHSNFSICRNRCNFSRFCQLSIQTKASKNHQGEQKGQALEKVEGALLFAAFASAIGWTCTVVIGITSPKLEKTTLGINPTVSTPPLLPRFPMQNASSIFQVISIWILYFLLLTNWLLRRANSTVQKVHPGKEVKTEGGKGNEIWKVISKLTRQQSKSGVKQRLSRRIFEAKLESLSDEHISMNDALMTYGKEFKNMQSEVGQIYSILGALEKAIRTQNKIVSELAVQSSQQGGLRSRTDNGAKAVGDECSSQTTHTMVGKVQQQLKKSSSFEQSSSLNPLQLSLLAQLDRSSSFTCSQSKLKSTCNGEGWTTYKF